MSTLRTFCNIRMGQLILKGDSRQLESLKIINILENLGGINLGKFKANNPHAGYYLDNNNYIRMSSYLPDEALTVDQFLNSFPFKLGDNILTIQDGFEGIIVAMRWRESTNEVLYDFRDTYIGTIRQNFSASDLELVVYRPSGDDDDNIIADTISDDTPDEPGEPREELVHVVKGIPSTMDINQKLANGYTVAKMLPDPKEGIWVLLKRIN